MDGNDSSTHRSTIPAIILAAGKGTRMQTDRPKAVLEVDGKPMVRRVAEALGGAGIGRVIAVVGHRSEEVRAALGEGVEFAVQEEQLGTGHAVKCTYELLRDYQGPVVVTCADIPLLNANDVTQLVDHHLRTAASATLLTAVLGTPGTLGRIIRNGDGSVQSIIEARDANPGQLTINEINVGVYCFDAPLLFELLATLRSENAQHQYYLTDVIGLLVAHGRRIEALQLEQAANGIGVNTLDDLAKVHQLVAGA